MDLSINLKTELCKQTIVKTINDLELPLGTAYYLLKDLTEEVGKIYFKAISKQQEEIQKQQEPKENKNEDEEQNQTNDQK